MIMVKVRLDFFDQLFSVMNVYGRLVIIPLGSFSGGIFSLYSLLCRHAKFSLLPNHQAADEELSTYHGSRYSNRNMQSSSVKKFAERHKKSKTALLLLVLFGTCLVICVGFLTPAMSSMCPSFPI